MVLLFFDERESALLRLIFPRQESVRFWFIDISAVSILSLILYYINSRVWAVKLDTATLLLNTFFDVEILASAMVFGTVRSILGRRFGSQEIGVIPDSRAALPRLFSKYLMRASVINAVLLFLLSVCIVPNQFDIQFIASRVINNIMLTHDPNVVECLWPNHMLILLSASLILLGMWFRLFFYGALVVRIGVLRFLLLAISIKYALVSLLGASAFVTFAEAFVRVDWLTEKESVLIAHDYLYTPFLTLLAALCGFIGRKLLIHMKWDRFLPEFQWTDG